MTASIVCMPMSR